MNSILNNSFMGTPDPMEPSRKTKQYSDLLSIRFINDFHWRREQNNGRQNKGSDIVLQCKTISVMRSSKAGFPWATAVVWTGDDQPPPELDMAKMLLPFLYARYTEPESLWSSAGSPVWLSTRTTLEGDDQVTPSVDVFWRI